MDASQMVEGFQALLRQTREETKEERRQERKCDNSPVSYTHLDVYKRQFRT